MLAPLVYASTIGIEQLEPCFVRQPVQDLDFHRLTVDALLASLEGYGENYGFDYGGPTALAGFARIPRLAARSTRVELERLGAAVIGYGDDYSEDYGGSVLAGGFRRLAVPDYMFNREAKPHCVRSS